MRDRTTNAMFLIEVILGVLLAVLIAAGLAAAAGTGYKIGPYAAFGTGLTMIAIGSVAASVVVSLDLHRRHREQIELLRDGQDKIAKRIDAIAVATEKTQENVADELGHQRRDHDHM